MARRTRRWWWSASVVLALGCGGSTQSTGEKGKPPPTYRIAKDGKTRSGGGLSSVAKLLEGNDLAAAATAAQAHIDENPKDPRGYYSLGTVLGMSGKLDDARKAFKRCLELEPNHAAAYNNLGIAAFEQGDLDAAEQAFRAAIRRDPDAAEPWANLGALMLKRRVYPRALDAYIEARQRAPTSLPVRLGYADAQWRMAHRDQAIEEYLAILDQHEDTSEAHAGVSGVLRELGRYDQAIKHARRAVQLAPKDPVALTAAAMAFDFKGNVKVAEGFYKQALRASPGFLGALYNYAVFLEEQKRPVGAIPLLERYLEAAPKQHPARTDVERRLERLKKSAQEP